MASYKTFYKEANGFTLVKIRSNSTRSFQVESVSKLLQFSTETLYLLLCYLQYTSYDVTTLVNHFTILLQPIKFASAYQLDLCSNLHF
jgi:hypothetical protein